ncbi:restriction endonuclease subunit S [Staphylococcus pasteuri]|uniref:restriction endonuclease subunit S n=2 Tax=Bacilli TaxID=91061 RepID=UPI0036CE1439
MNMTNKSKVRPQLRFEKFKDDWIKLNLNEVSERVKRKNKDLESLMPLTISGQYGLVDQVTYFSKSVSAKNLEKYTLIKNGEFAYNKSYSNGYPLGAIKRLDRYEKGALSTLYICFKVNEMNDSNFIKYFFETTKWHKEVSSIAVEGARNHGLLNISVNDFFNIMINLPTLEEQQKIGDFFSKLDRQIELEKEKLELLEQQKRGYMQKIFSQQLRFKDENGNEYPDWKDTKLNSIADIKTGNKNAQDSIENGKYMFFDRSVDIKYLNTFDFDEEAIIYPGEGSKFLPRYFKGKYSLHQRAYSIHNIKIDPQYLYNYLELQNNHFLKYAVGSTVKSLRMIAFNKLIISSPVMDEQEKIGNFFNKIDNLIELQTNKIESLKQRKKGLLQKMFV